MEQDVFNCIICIFFISVCVDPSATMDDESARKIKERLGTKTLKKTGYTASGCINHGEGYATDSGEVFIKSNKNAYAKVMFESEIASLKALEQTDTVRVPHPVALVEGSHDTYYCVLEFVTIRGLSKFNSELGEKLAELHLHNEKVAKGGANYVSQFGFPITTCVGLLPTDNTWHDDWPTFYTHRLDEQVQRLMKKKRDAELQSLWSEFQPLVPKFFENIEVKPSLLHGDLWGGNVGETDTEPIIFDPGSVYGHHEFDLAMTSMFGRLSNQFYKAYHERIPKAPGFDTREDLYHLFHYLNHWNHFGSGYRGQSISIMKRLIRTRFPLA